MNSKTIAKWRKRDFVHDAPMGPKFVHSKSLTEIEEAVVVAFRVFTQLPLDDSLYTLQTEIPHLSRPSFLTDNGVQFANRKKDMMAFMTPFDRICIQHGIEYRLTRVNHPWTNGQVERRNRTLKEAPVARYHYSCHAD